MLPPLTCHLAWEPAPPARSLGKGHRPGAARGYQRRPGRQSQGCYGARGGSPGADDVLMQAALAALALGPEAREALLQGVQVRHLQIAGQCQARCLGAPQHPVLAPPHLLLVQL